MPQTLKAAGQSAGVRRVRSRQVKKVSKLKYPKHPRPMHVGGDLPQAHFYPRHIFDAELPPNREEIRLLKEKQRFVAAWKYPPPTSKGPNFTENEKMIIKPTYLLQLEEKEEDPSAETKNETKEPEPEESEESKKQPKWRIVGQPFLGPFGKYPYQSDIELLVWQRRNGVDEMKRKSTTEFPPLAGPWIPSDGTKSLPDACFTPSYPYLTSDTLPPNNYELWLKASEYPDFKNYRSFHAANFSRGLNPLRDYLELPLRYHIEPGKWQVPPDRENQQFFQ